MLPRAGATFSPVASPAELPHADEALKALVKRFKDAPGSSACSELAAALLARGHAAEALRIAEHGLQLIPDNVDGRVERAAALLAMGRPRVAYVELRRALAISTSHQRAMRLLGQAFRDAGAPGRAAKLLAKRSIGEDDFYEETKPALKSATPPSAKTERIQRSKLQSGGPKNPEPSPAQDNKSAWDVRPKGKGAIPAELFQDLTKDLGLGGAVPEGPPRRVEVTQIIRRKGLPRPPRSASELAEIDGPIVDTTQPGQIVETQQIDPAPTSPKEPAPLFPGPSDQIAALSGFALDDEPLFQEDMPFQVRPVDGDQGEEPRETKDPASRPTPPSKGRKDPVGAPAWASEAPTTQARPELPRGLQNSPEAISPSADTVVDEVEDQGPLDEPVPAAIVPELSPAEQDAPPIASATDKIRFEGGVPIVERGQHKKKQTPRLEIVEAKAKPAHVLLAVLGLALIVLYTAGLIWASKDTLQAWWSPTGQLIQDGQPASSAKPSLSKRN